MKQGLKVVGITLFWLGWPAWWLYFRNSNERSRVLVIWQDEVLLVQGWLSTHKWMLPGGGSKHHESSRASAVRELKEEVGINADKSALRLVGTHEHTQYGLHYQATYFVLELEDKPSLKRQQHEISDMKWHKLSDIRGRMLDEDAAYALKQYVPLDQTSLL